MTRLPYDTEAGNLSSAGTYSQLVEHLRLAAEAAHVLCHYHKAQGDDVKGIGFQGVGLYLERIVTLVTDLATKGVRQ